MSLSILAARLAPLLLAASLTGCLTVPREVVELSYRMGQDLESTHVLHVNLIRAHFRLLREERRAYVDDVWAPRFIRRFLKDGRLQDIASGSVVWSPERRAFGPASPGMEGEGLDRSLLFWATAALQAIEQKRATLLDPLDTQEKDLVASVDEAFARLARANATVTAQLNSLRKVQDAHDSGLSALHLGGLREQINSQLHSISEVARKGLEEAKKADGLLDKVQPSTAP